MSYAITTKHHKLQMFLVGRQVTTRDDIGDKNKKKKKQREHFVKDLYLKKWNDDTVDSSHSIVKTGTNFR